VTSLNDAPDDQGGPTMPTDRSVAMANAVPEPSHHDGRIALDDVVSFRCPPFLTTDYDPTHRANIR